MWKSIPNVNNAIVQASLKKYQALPKSGKPLFHETKAEWTVLASIVLIYCGNIISWRGDQNTFFDILTQTATPEEHTISVISLG